MKSDRKNTGFWKRADQKDRKNTGFCIGAKPKPCFFPRFHAARLTDFHISKTKKDMKVFVFNDKSTNRPKHSVKENVKTQGSGKNMKKQGPEPRILRDTPQNVPTFTRKKR